MSKHYRIENLRFVVSYHDPTNNSITLKNFRLDIKDFNSIPTPNTQAKKFLDDAVPCTTTNGLPNSDTVIDTEQYQLRIRSKSREDMLLKKRILFIKVQLHGLIHGVIVSFV